MTADELLMHLLPVVGRELPLLLTSLLGGLFALGFVRRCGKSAVFAALGCGLLFLSTGVSAVERVHVQQPRAIESTRWPSVGRPLRAPPPALTLLDVGVGGAQVVGLGLLVAAALAGRRAKPAA